MDVPVHRNAGDLFILAATEHLLRTLDCHVVHRTGVRDYRLSRVRRLVGPETILLGLGGGNFGDDYPRYQALRESMVRDFPDNRIVIMPQTIHFSTARSLDRATEVLRAHKDLHVAARDEASAGVARAFTPNVVLLPDIVDVLGRDMPLPPLPGRGRGEVVLMRRDQEAAPDSRPAVDAVDWPDVFPELLGRVAVTAGAMAVAPRMMSVRLHASWSAYAGEVFDRGRGWMSSATHVVTDRLHGAILARLAGSEVTLRDGGYGKLAAYYERWWKDDVKIRLQPRVRE